VSIGGAAAVFLRRKAGALPEYPVEIGDVVEARLGGYAGNGDPVVFQERFSLFNLCGIAVIRYAASYLALEESSQVFFVVVKHRGEVCHRKIVQQIFSDVAFYVFDQGIHGLLGSLAVLIQKKSDVAFHQVGGSCAVL